MRDRSAERGFTLIELLVSLTVLGLLLVLLFGGLRFGMRAWERGTLAGAAGETQDAAQSLLRRTMERICVRIAPPPPGDNGPPRVQFAGTADRVRFLAPLPQALGGAQCRPLTVQARDDGKRETLALRYGRGDEAVVLSGLQGISFAYQGGDGRWRDAWIAQPKLPALIRVRITFPPGDGREWPEMFVAPRISASPDCVYDTTTGGCRGR